MTLNIDRRSVCPAGKIMAAVSALSGEGSARLRMSSFDSILIPAAGVDAPLDRAELCGELVVVIVDGVEDRLRHATGLIDDHQDIARIDALESSRS